MAEPEGSKKNKKQTEKKPKDQKPKEGEKIANKEKDTKDVEKKAPAPEKKIPVTKNESQPRPKTSRRVALGYGIVRAVNSGDSIVLVGGAPPGQAPPVKDIGISGIVAPKFARSKTQKDEPFSWESREFLRKKILGQQVAFKINAGEEEGREYGTLYINDENITHTIVRHGWAKVKPLAPAALREELNELQKVAEAEGLGVWSKQDKHHQRVVDWTPDRNFLLSLKGKQVHGVVDKVLSGSILRVEIFNSSEPSKHKMITLNLAGAQSPRVPLPIDYLLKQYELRKEQNPNEERPKAETSPPFAEEAVRFTEARLLHQEVDIIIQGVDKIGACYGSIVHPQGNITLKLLEAGLAKKVAWSAALTDDISKINDAENLGKLKKINLWHNDADNDIPKEFIGKVMFVASGDTLLIKDANGVEKRYSLASIRCPRLGNPRRGEAEEPFSFEAREFVRTKLIGKNVRVIPEYVQISQATREPRDYATVLLSNQDIGEALVAAGLAEVTRHGQDGERSSNYGKLLEAELSAEKTGRGIYEAKSGKKPTNRIVDLTERFQPADKELEEKEVPKDTKGKSAPAPAKAKPAGSRARQYLGFLQRDKQLQGVVEYVFSGHRFKLYIPKEHLMLFFSLAGVRAPVKTAEQADPLAAAAQEFMRSRVLQQTVTVEIETMDKGENFIGTMFFNNQNMGAKLLREGLASTTPSVSRSPYGAKLVENEKLAKDEKKGIWENYVESAVNEDDEAAEEPVDTSATLTVLVTEIVDAATFYFRSANDSVFPQVTEAMKEFQENLPSAPEDWEPKKGELVAGLFTDELWYRVKIESKTQSGDFKVFFLDYGNHETLDKQFLLPLPDNLQKLPGSAKAAVLAGIKAPGASNEHYEGAALAFNEMAWEKELQAKVECKGRDGKTHITLTPPGEDTSINKELVSQGWCRVVARPEYALRELCESFKAAESDAKTNRYNIWQYGDVSDDEDDEKRRRDDGRPPRR